jgi:hypothetical protein
LTTQNTHPFFQEQAEEQAEIISDDPDTDDTVVPVVAPNVITDKVVEPDREIKIEEKSREKSTKGKPRIRSEVWDHFTQSGDNVYECIHCKKPLPNKPKWGTSNLIIHLQACVGLKNSPLQTALKLQPKGKSNLSPEDQDEADRLLLRVIVGDERPFSFAQTTRFQEFCKKIAPEYKIPVDNTLDKKFQEEFETTKVVLNKLITSLPAFSITMDGWKSMCGDSYASFEVHFWDFKCNKKTTRTWTVLLLMLCTVRVKS